MKILAISDLFPPHFIGGYELACAELMTRLAERGHEVRVLTSDYRGPIAGNDVALFPVARLLKFLPDGGARFPGRPWRPSVGDCLSERSASHAVTKAVDEFRPDVVSVWHLSGVSPVVFQTCLRLKIKVVFAISDYWLLHPDLAHHWYRYWSFIPTTGAKRLVKLALRTTADRLLAPTQFLPGPIRHAHFFSAYLQDAYAQRGPNVLESVVIRHGVDLDRYRPKRAREHQGTQLLYVGRLSPEKGVDIAIRALANLTSRYNRHTVELHLAGGGEPDYVDELRSLACELGLDERVRFLGLMSRDEAANLYERYDALLFTSSWPEPFSITLIEALACGLPVVGTGTGGSGEILTDGENALVVRPNDPGDLSDKIEIVLRDPLLREALSAAARRSVERMCDVQAVVGSVEDYYRKIAAG